MNFRIPIGTVVSGTEFLAFIVAAACIAVHAPGQASMDTSIQLYEALTGESMSWNPPFMSALMNWMGGGEMSMTGVVLLSTALIYMAYVAVVRSVAMAKQQEAEMYVPVWRALAVWLLMLNPIVAIYVGIVWKDVLFGALLTASASFGISACVGVPTRRWVFSILSVLLLVPALLIRQQGIFMAPVLLLVPAIAVSFDQPRRQALARYLIVGLVFLAGVIVLQVASSSTIRGNDGRSSSIGFRSIIIFDAMGIVSNSSRRADEFAYPISEAELLAVRSVYGPGRIDYIAKSAVAESWLGAASPSMLKHAWWILLKQNPGAYLHHRFDAVTTLLGVRAFSETQPVHVGIDGNTAYLEAAGVTPGRNARSLWLYRFAAKFFTWPIYRHVFWLFASIICCVVLFKNKSSSPLRNTTRVVNISVLLLFFSFVPTMISSDFRYLFAGIPLTTLVSMVLFMALPGSTVKNLLDHIKGRAIK